MKNCIYRFLNESDEVIYIGKARDLEKRIHSHTHLSDECYKETKKVEYLQFNTDTEMIIAEVYLINKFKPKYNKSSKGKSVLTYVIAEIDNKKWINYGENVFKNKREYECVPKGTNERIKHYGFVGLMKEVQEDNTLTLDSVLNIGRNVEEALVLYEELLNKGIDFIFIKNPECNTEKYKSAFKEANESNKEFRKVMEHKEYFQIVEKILKDFILDQFKIVYEQSKDKLKGKLKDTDYFNYL